MNKANRRVIIIGLDGGTWQILDPLMEEGKAPFFSQSGKERSTWHPAEYDATDNSPGVDIVPYG